MKKQIKIALICAVSIILLVLVVVFTNNTKKTPLPQEGTYEITGNESFPDAYIVVANKQIQFFNIDLNKFYKQKYTDTFLKLQDRGVISGYTEEELSEYADVNKLFIENAFPLKQAIISQEDAHLYRYHCSTFINANGMTFFYDSQNQQIYFGTDDGNFYFKKVK